MAQAAFPLKSLMDSVALIDARAIFYTSMVIVSKMHVKLQVVSQAKLNGKCYVDIGLLASNVHLFSFPFLY